MYLAPVSSKLHMTVSIERQSLGIMLTPVLFVAGVFVLGPGRQGILYEYREKEFGDLANTTDILAAVRKMRATTS